MMNSIVSRILIYFPLDPSRLLYFNLVAVTRSRNEARYIADSLLQGKHVSHVIHRW